MRKIDVDLIVSNGLIYTVDSSFTRVSAMAVRDGKIIDLGESDDILARYSSPELIDLKGNYIYPGLIDGHCHFYGYATNLVRAVELKGTRSFDEVLTLLEQFHDKYPDSWIVGRGWDQNDWEVREFPDNTRLDELFPLTPVVLTRIDGHAVLANSSALQVASINISTSIPGGNILKKDGKLTGILIDNAADIMKSFIPEPDNDMMVSGLKQAEMNCFNVGLTSVTDAGLGKKEIYLLDSLQKSGALRLRINAMLSATQENFDEFLSKGIYRTEKLQVNSVKLFTDGALGSRGALLIEPYSDDPGNRGLLITSREVLKDVVNKAYHSGYQVNTHCIGDSANRLILNLYGEVLQGKNDRRWRIEHAQIVNPEDFRLFGEFSIIPSIQSTHATSDMYWAQDRVGGERIKGAYATKDLLKQNGWIINGTDFPVEDISPLATFYAAVARKDKEGWPEGGFLPEQKLSREDALRSITIWAAKGSFEEDIKGSLEPGKVADFVALDRDIMEIPEAELLKVKVLKTFIAGQQVFPNL